jgi:hypothetical protein
MAPALVEGGLAVGGPGVGQLDDEVAKVLLGNAGEARNGSSAPTGCTPVQNASLGAAVAWLDNRLVGSTTLAG